VSTDDEDLIPLGAHDDEDDEQLLAPGEPPDQDVRTADGADMLVDEPAHTADSPFDRIRAAYDKRLEVKRLVMEMPGWDGELLIEFGLLGKREAKQLRSASRGDRSDMTKVVSSLLSLAHKGLSEYGPDGNVRPLVQSGGRVRLADVGKFLPVRVENDRAGFMALFQEGPARELNETSLQSFANEVGRWMADTSAVVTGAVDQTIDADGTIVAESVDPGS
jgi:hypothetical protein